MAGNKSTHLVEKLACATWPSQLMPTVGMTRNPNNMTLVSTGWSAQVWEHTGIDLLHVLNNRDGTIAGVYSITFNGSFSKSRNQFFLEKGNLNPHFH